MNTKIYKILLDYQFAIIDVAEEELDSLFSFDEGSVDLEKYHLNWLTNESSEIPNISIIIAEFICCNSKAKTSIEGHEDSLAFTPLRIGESVFYSISQIPVLKERINLRASKVKRFSDGDIMEITSPVFNEGDYPFLFKTDLTDGTFFCTEKFKHIIDNNGLTGLIFEECKVKSKSWLFN